MKIAFNDVYIYVEKIEYSIVLTILNLLKLFINI